MNPDNFKARASQMHRICSYREAGHNLTATQMKGIITFCEEVEKEHFFGFRPDVTVDTMEKGILGQSAAVTLFNKVLNERTGRFVVLKENKERISDDDFTGEPDVYQGINIRTVDEGFDTKCSKDITTFPRWKTILDDTYFWQNMTYIALTGAKRWTTVYALVNTPGYQLLDKKERLFKALGSPDEDSRNGERYREKAILLEKNNIFDIDLFRKENPNTDLENKDWSHLKKPSERIKEFVVERDEDAIQFMRNRVNVVRNYMMKTFKS